MKSDKLIPKKIVNKIKGDVKINKEIGNTKRERDFSFMDVIFCFLFFFVFGREGIKLYEWSENI